MSALNDPHKSPMAKISSHTDWKYAPKDQHVLYTTTANDIGKIVPAATDLPHQRYGRSKKFTAHLAQAGPYRNCSLNTK